MKLAMMTFYNDAIKHYGDITSKINQMYCNIHNITWVVSNEPKYKNRHPAWENLPLLLEHVDSYDYVIWIDADAFFYIDALNITTYINEHPDVDFIFSRDLGNKCPPEGEINTGIFIVKNTEYSKKFLNTWAYDEKLFQDCKMKYRWDQGVLNDMYTYNTFDIRSSEHSFVYEYGILQHFYKNELNDLNTKPLIYHMAGRRACGKEHERFDDSHEYYEKIRNLE